MSDLHIPEFLKSAIKKLGNSNHQAFIVGGAIRDFYLNRPVLDWDIATSAKPDEIKSIFCGLRYFALKHETITLLPSKEIGDSDKKPNLEITSFKGSGDSIEEDLSHRDFTINAMAYDLVSGRIFDPFEGRIDINRKLIKAVKDPVTRFSEDPVRLLRAIRFANELGFKVEAETANGMLSSAHLLCSVAKERIRDELLKILISSKPSKGINMALETGILKQFLPELLEGIDIEQNIHHKFTIYEHLMTTTDGVEPRPNLRMAAFLHDIAKPRVRKKAENGWTFLGHEEKSADLAVEILTRLKFNKEMISKTSNLVKHHMIGYNSAWKDGAVRRLVRRVGPEAIDDLIALRYSDILAHGKGEQKVQTLSELKRRIDELRKNPLPTKTCELAINGTKVMEVLGIGQGIRVGNVLKTLLEKITDHPELNNEQDLVSILKSMNGI